jgi:hypothetical protein
MVPPMMPASSVRLADVDVSSRNSSGQFGSMIGLPDESLRIR